MKIVVLSRNPNLYSTKRLVEAGEQTKHEMLVVDHSKCDLLIEKKNPIVIYKGKTGRYRCSNSPDWSISNFFWYCRSASVRNDENFFRCGVASFGSFTR